MHLYCALRVQPVCNCLLDSRVPAWLCACSPLRRNNTELPAILIARSGRGPSDEPASFSRYGGGGGYGGGGSSNHGGYTSSGDSDRSALDAARLAAMLSASGIDLQSLITSAGLAGGQVCGSKGTTALGSFVGSHARGRVPMNACRDDCFSNRTRGSRHPHVCRYRRRWGRAR